MKSRVICISRSLAAGGQNVARAVSQKLNYRYVDEDIVKQAADREKVDVAVIEDAERRQSFLNRLLESFAVAPAPEMMALTPGLPLTAGFTREEVEAAGAVRTTEHYRQLIRDVIQETANQGDVVIFAHAAAMALGGGDEVLRVLITASPQSRAERVAAAYALSPRDAEKAIRESDKARRDYLKDFYGIGEELPTHYDVVINTDVLSPQRAVDIILAAARG